MIKCLLYVLHTRAAAANRIGLFMALRPAEETAQSFLISMLNNATKEKASSGFYETGLKLKQCGGKGIEVHRQESRSKEVTLH